MSGYTPLPEPPPARRWRYEVGDELLYLSFGGERRRCRVTEKHADIKHGRPGFNAILLGPNGEPRIWEEQVWGYDEQIEQVIR